ncbi:MAG: hypothetical protein IJX37_03190 [Oscillospiraceae bacterium]|nr:hypothetical protein [Oscillospiraceae bacterium]
MDIIEMCTGTKIADRLQYPAKELYVNMFRHMQAAFGDNVEYERLAKQVLFCPETEAYLYQTPEPVRYRRGMRPALDAVIDEVCAECVTERQKVLAILVYIRDLRLKYRKYGRDIDFYGGTEEDLIKKGERYCERVARLMTALCEVAGMPGRVIFHVSTGHLTNEIYVEGGWAYFDPRYGIFYVDENDRFLSVRELIADPGVIYHQPQWATDYFSYEFTLKARQDRNAKLLLAPKQIQCYGPYSLTEAEQYHYGWMPCLEGCPEERLLPHRAYVKYRKEYEACDLYNDGVTISL